MALQVIYKPKGKALEYSSYAVNPYIGCDCGCKYCFAPGVARKTRDEYLNVRARDNYLKKLEHDCKELKGLEERVLLSFMTDPYNSLEQEMRLTRSTLEMFNEYNIPFQVLTKRGGYASEDFNLYRECDAFASTLTFTNGALSKEWEPGAQSHFTRVTALEKAHDMKINTWVSLEPIIDSAEAIKIINQTYKFVDLYKVGKLNHSKDNQISNIDVENIINLLNRYGKKYIVKEDTKKLLVK